MAAEPIQLHASAASATASDAGQSGCACGHHEEEALVLDTRQIPHAIRHATIFGALDSLAVGISLDLIANHNPLPLLAQLAQRHPDGFETSYIDDGPEMWTLRLTRMRA